MESRHNYWINTNSHLTDSMVQKVPGRVQMLLMMEFNILIMDLMGGCTERV